MPIDVPCRTRAIGQVIKETASPEKFTGLASYSRFSGACRYGFSQFQVRVRRRAATSSWTLPFSTIQLEDVESQ